MQTSPVFSSKAFQAILAEKSTPFYCYDLALLDKTLDSLKLAADQFEYQVHYALKANSNEEILNLIASKNFGADCVSGNEVKRALEIGFRPDHIVFAGVGKSDSEILFALQQNIFCFNCESLQEIEVINELAKKSKTKASIALRLNPNVNANTHKYITTGLEENKFGINLWELDSVLDRFPTFGNINLIGLHFHIGSQITDLGAFKSLCLRVNEIQKIFDDKKIILEHINLGGGLGIDYHEPDINSIPDFESFFKLFKQFLEPRPGQQIHFELGRAVVAQCGSLISKVLFVKKGVNTRFIILDAGMTELIRPALYQSYHKIENLTSLIIEPLRSKESFRSDIVGPICESSDCFAKSLLFPETERGDFVAIRSTGAYGEVMTSNYNLREKVAAFYVSR